MADSSGMNDGIEFDRSEQEVCACSPISVTQDSFAEHKDGMIEAISTADIIAIDTEFSGLAADPLLASERSDSIESRYCRYRHASGKIALTQFGVSTLAYRDETWVSTGSFSVFMFPGSGSRRIVAQASSLAFLADNSFNFNAFVNGVRYRSEESVTKLHHSKAMATRARALRPQQPISVDREHIADDIADIVRTIEAWRQSLMAQPTPHTSSSSSSSAASIEAASSETAAASSSSSGERWKQTPFRTHEDGDSSCPVLVLPPNGGRHRKIAHDVVAVAFPGMISTKAIDSDYTHFEAASAAAGQPNAPSFCKAMRVICISDPAEAAADAAFLTRLSDSDTVAEAWPEETTPANPAVAARREAELEAELAAIRAADDDDSGLSAVFAAISARKCPVVVHNGGLDAIHCLSAFCGSLPSSPEAYAEMVRARMPKLLDTKGLLQSEPALQGSFKGTSLQEAFDRASESGFAATRITAAPLAALESATTATDAAEPLAPKAVAAAHDAGYDAFMTAVVCVRSLERAGLTAANIARLRDVPEPSCEAVVAEEIAMERAWIARNEHRAWERAHRGWQRRQAKKAEQIPVPSSVAPETSSSSSAAAAEVATSTVTGAGANAEAVGSAAADQEEDVEDPEPTEPTSTARVLSSPVQALAAHSEALCMQGSGPYAPKRWRLRLACRDEINTHVGARGIVRRETEAAEAAADEAAAVAIDDATAEVPAASLGFKALTLHISGLNWSFKPIDVAAMVASAAGIPLTPMLRKQTSVDGQSQAFVTLPSIEALRQALNTAAEQHLKQLQSLTEAVEAANPQLVMAGVAVPEHPSLTGVDPQLIAIVARQASDVQSSPASSSSSSSSLTSSSSSAPAVVTAQHTARQVASALLADSGLCKHQWRGNVLPELGSFRVQTYAALVRSQPDVFSPGVCDFEYSGVPIDLIDRAEGPTTKHMPLKSIPAAGVPSKRPRDTASTE